MDFLKKHYEKVVLGVVLLGLAVGAVFLILMIPAEREALKELVDNIVQRKSKELPTLEITRQMASISRPGSIECLDLASTNKVFNSMQWQRKSDGSLLKIVLGNEVGPDAVTVTKIVPLFTTIALDSVAMSAEGTPRYSIMVEREAAPKPNQRAKRQMVATLNTKAEVFVLREVKGTPDNPSELILEMNDTGEHLTLSKEKPIRRIDGYMADFNYPPEPTKKWANVRVGAGATGTMPQIAIAGESYIVVAITKNEVVLSAKSNNKKTPRPYTPTP